ncbi:hypothetical protein G5I_07107 [Acromyrmex echinatior]|uniref:Uncharacterized protein n=1 Tax=Acromyrmex echinatior TaxID=103372 RepID=F4WMX0_ACREC|nr:hypothetical protein G5I_07107 [Acromyrmex echinatior]
MYEPVLLFVDSDGREGCWSSARWLLALSCSPALEPLKSGVTTTIATLQTVLLRRKANAYDNDENDKDDKNDASRPDDDKVPEVRSRLKLDGTLRAAYLFPQIDPKMVSDEKMGNSGKYAALGFTLQKSEKIEGVECKSKPLVNSSVYILDFDIAKVEQPAKNCTKSKYLTLNILINLENSIARFLGCVVTNSKHFFLSAEDRRQKIKNPELSSVDTLDLIFLIVDLTCVIGSVTVYLL